MISNKVLGTDHFSIQNKKTILNFGKFYLTTFIISLFLPMYVGVNILSFNMDMTKFMSMIVFSVFLLHIFIRGKVSFNKESLFFLFFILSLITSSYFSNNPMLSLIYSTSDVVLLYMAFYFGKNCGENLFLNKAFQKAFFVLIIMIFFYMLIERVVGFSLIPYLSIASGATTFGAGSPYMHKGLGLVSNGWYGYSLSYAQIMFCFFIINIILLKITKNKKFFVTLALIFCCIVLAQSRAAYFALILMLISFYMFGGGVDRNFDKLKRSPIFVLIFILVFFTFTLLALFLSYTYIQNELNNPNSSFSTRLVGLYLSLTKLSSEYLILGYGGMSKTALIGESYDSLVQGQRLDLLLPLIWAIECGVHTLLFFFAMIFFLIKKHIKNKLPFQIKSLYIHFTIFPLLLAFTTGSSTSMQVYLFILGNLSVNGGLDVNFRKIRNYA